MIDRMVSMGDFNMDAMNNISRFNDKETASFPAPTGSSDDYSPVKCLREEVERFKATNRFSPMLVTNFYAQAAVVLSYTAELEEELKRMISRAEYVCAHKYGESNPIGTRIIAVSDLQGQLNHAKRVLRWQNE